MCCQKIKQNLHWKMNFLKQATYIGYVLGKLPDFVQIITLNFAFLIEFFDKNFFCDIA